MVAEGTGTGLLYPLTLTSWPRIVLYLLSLGCFFGGWTSLLSQPQGGLELLQLPADCPRYTGLCVMPAEAGSEVYLFPPGLGALTSQLRSLRCFSRAFWEVRHHHSLPASRLKGS